jgi:hypothetical protein
MGAGASTTSEAAIAAAAKPQQPGKKAKEIFAALAGKDGKRASAENIKKAIKKQKDMQGDDWNDEHIESIIRQFDLDGDGQLSEAEWHAVLSEIKARGGGLASIGAAATKKRKEEEAAAAADAAPKVDPAVLAAWDKCTDAGGDDLAFERKHMANLVRGINDKEGLWDDNDFGPYVKSQFELLCGSTEKKAVGSKSMFLAWYPPFAAWVQAQIDEREAAWKAEKEAKAAGGGGAGAGGSGGSSPAGLSYEGAVWQCPMSALQTCLKHAWNVGKTPLLIDATTPSDGDSQGGGGGFSPLEVFYSYSGEGLVELKKHVVEVSMKKTKTVEEAQDEMAKTTLMCLKQGRMLTLLCSTSAPPMTSKFACAHFPLALLDAGKVKPVVGPEAESADSLKDTWVQPVLDWGEAQGLNRNPAYGPVVVVNKDFRVVVVTKFSVEDYADFMASEWPLELLQPVRVFAES